MKKLILGAAIALAFQAAHAVALINDTAVALPGTTVAAEPQLAGLILEDKLTDFSIAALGITGHVQSRVVRSSVDGTLDFYWRVFNDDTSRGSIGNFRIGEFYSPEYNANWRIDGLGDVAPTSAYMFGGSYAGKGYINFQFFDAAGGGQIDPGESSRFMFLDTSATAYNELSVMDVANIGTTSISGLMYTFGPTAPVPEPSTYALMGLGLAALGFMRRKSKQE